MDVALKRDEVSFRSDVMCPVHDCQGYDAKMAALWRRKSVDSDYVFRPDMMAKRNSFQCEAVFLDGRQRPKSPFQHSHSVSCTVDGHDPPAAVEEHQQRKASSVGSLRAPPRKRPNVLELCPNNNTSFNAFRKRYSRSSERCAADCDDYGWEPQSSSGFLRPSSRSRSSHASFAREFGGTSGVTFTYRRDSGSDGRWSGLRKGLSLLSLCAGDDDDDFEDFKTDSRRILRPPTRYFYQKGISGLPVKCRAKYMGLAY